MRISWEGRKGVMSEHHWGSVPGTAPQVTSSLVPPTGPAPVPGSEGCSDHQRSRSAALSHCGPALSPLFFLPGECGVGRRRCGCRQGAEPGGRTAQAHVPSLVPLPSPASPCCVRGTGCPCSHTGVQGIAGPLGWHRSELPAEGQMLSPLPNPPYVLPCPKSAGAAELDATGFCVFVSSGENYSFGVGPTKTSTETSPRARWAF